LALDKEGGIYKASLAKVVNGSKGLFGKVLAGGRPDDLLASVRGRVNYWRNTQTPDEFQQTSSEILGASAAAPILLQATKLQEWLSQKPHRLVRKPCFLLLSMGNQLQTFHLLQNLSPKKKSNKNPPRRLRLLP
jgi:hypothetical protein